MAVPLPAVSHYDRDNINGGGANMFQGALAHLSDLHSAEVGELQRRNSQLHEYVSKLRTDLDTMDKVDFWRANGEGRRDLLDIGTDIVVKATTTQPFGMTVDDAIRESLAPQRTSFARRFAEDDVGAKSSYRSAGYSRQSPSDIVSFRSFSQAQPPMLSEQSLDDVAVTPVAQAPSATSLALERLAQAQSSLKPSVFQRWLSHKKAAEITAKNAEEHSALKQAHGKNSLTKMTGRITQRSNKSQAAMGLPGKSLLDLPPEQRFLGMVILHPLFDTVCATMILLNSVLIGWSVEYMTVHDEEATWMIIAGHICSAFFFIELALRMTFYKLRAFFLTSEDRNWNYFDTLLVAFSVLDLIMSAIGSDGGTGAVTSGIKTIKMLRIVRVFRVFRFFRELSLLALMIIDSMKSLMWALLMLTIIIYVFSICFTTAATDHIKLKILDGEMHLGVAEVDRQFGSMAKTVYSLIQGMLGGVSWGVISDALLTIDWFTSALFFFYVFFTVLAVLNIITGVFVDNAVETARNQRDFMVQKEMELKEKYVKEMRDLFSQMDEDGSGTVCLQEVEEYLDDPRMKSYFQALGLDPHDSQRLFTLLETDGSGEVGVDAFIDGCLRLKGQARSIDVYAIICQCQRIEAKLCDLEIALRPGATNLRKKQKTKTSSDLRTGEICATKEHVAKAMEDRSTVNAFAMI